MACPEQHITRAQVLAGAAQRPALIWTSTGEEDLLSSGGVPIWYDIDGEVHTAAAHTWLPTAAGRRRGTAQPDRHIAYLPLDCASDHLPVIDVLRGGRHTGRHWAVIDIDPTGGHLIRPDAVRLADHRDEIAPPDATWQVATVKATAVTHAEYPALVADGYTVHGDDVDNVIARFGRATVERMVADLARVHADTNANRPDARRVRGAAPRRGGAGRVLAA